MKLFYNKEEDHYVYTYEHKMSNYQMKIRGYEHILSIVSNIDGITESNTNIEKIESYTQATSFLNKTPLLLELQIHNLQRRLEKLEKDTK
jgi:hypothetical protein